MKKPCRKLRFVLAAALLASASAFAEDPCASVDCAKEKNGTDNYSACCVPQNGDLGQQSDGSCHFKATTVTKSGETYEPIGVPSGTPTDAKTSGQGG